MRAFGMLMQGDLKVFPVSGLDDALRWTAE
jgi:hypothetical protein